MTAGVPRFSVMVTAFNYARYVTQAVDSAIAQTHRPTQIVVVDDGSTDGTLELLRERYSAVPFVSVLTQENAGQIAAAQRALPFCEGDVIAFLDGDDWWEPGYLETVARVYSEDPGVDYVYTNMRLRGAHEGKLLLPRERDYDSGISTLVSYFLGEGLSTATSAVSMRSSWARRALRVPRSLVREWRIGLDNCLGCGAGMLGARKVYLGAALVNYRLHDANGFFSKQQTRAEALQDTLRLRRLLKHYALAAGLGEDAIDWIRQEFQTRPEPTWEDTRRYLRIAGSHERSFLARIRSSVSILRHFLQPERAVRNRPSAG